ncbi:MAG: DUF4159 domain-containing protein [Chloroherpetonaceae bacterium]|nr:DUF4159 domain-containing protein [Chloroherpetonaceae bacterium]
MTRREFLARLAVGAAAVTLSPLANAVASQFERRRKDFVFTRLQYASGNWDTDQRMPYNLLNSLIEYTTIEVDTREKIVSLDSPALFDSPFCYLSGHKLVQFTTKERENFREVCAKRWFRVC